MDLPNIARSGISQKGADSPLEYEKLVGNADTEGWRTTEGVLMVHAKSKSGQ